jgi:nicotinamide mononucleotide transporter
MNWHAVLSYLVSNWVEIAGVITTVLGIWLTIRRLLVCWPVTLAADVLYIFVFYRARLYSGALLQVFFVVFDLYGWWLWWRGVRAEGGVRVAPLDVRSLWVGLAAGAAGSALLGYFMARIGAALPHLDAALTGYSLVATLWQARRHTANWWLWIVVNVIYVGEYIHQSLMATAALYAGLAALAVLGLRDWRRVAAAQMTA